jgi:hypothetical protein
MFVDSQNIKFNENALSDSLVMLHEQINKLGEANRRIFCSFSLLTQEK